MVSLSLGAVSSQGVELLCWGCGDLGQTGQGRDKGQGGDMSPQKGLLEAFTPGKLGTVKLLACGSSHSIVVTVDNRIFTWGNGSSGQLGDGERNVKDRPTEVFLPTGEAAGVMGVACGSRHTFIWTLSGEAFGFGNNFYTQLGYNFRKMDFKGNQLVPHLFRNLPSRRIVQVACGERHTLFALEDGSVAACGVNDYGQIGTRSCEDAAVPRFVEDIEDIMGIACGANHNLAVSGKGKVYQWGCGRACGNLKRNVTLPEEVSFPEAVSMKAACGGCWHSLLLTDDGKVYSWGMGQEGQLGHGEDMAFLSAPCLLRSSLLSPGVLQIDAGDNYSAAVTADGGLLMWGRNCHVMDAGQADSQRAWAPRTVVLGGWKVCAVSCGTWHAAALARPCAEGSWGNRESDFRETGALFKADSNYPQLMELEPRENSEQIPSVGTESRDPMIRTEVAPRRHRPHRPRNSATDDMDKTDLLRAQRSDSMAAAEEREQPAGNGHSSITRRGYEGWDAGPQGPSLKGRQALSRLRPPWAPHNSTSLWLGPDANSPIALPELQSRPLSQHRLRRPESAQLPSRELWEFDSDRGRRAAPSSRGLQQRSVPGSLPARMLPLSLGHQARQAGPWRTRHLSPLSPGSSPAPRPSSTPSPLLTAAGSSKPVYKQAIYSSGTAWKDVSMSADPVLSHKHLATTIGLTKSDDL